MIPLWLLSTALLLIPAVHSIEKAKNDVTSNTANTKEAAKDLKPDATSQDLKGPSQKTYEHGYAGYAGYKGQSPWVGGKKWQDYESNKGNSKYDGYGDENDYGKTNGNVNYGTVNNENRYSNENNDYQKPKGGNYGTNDKGYGQVSQYNNYGKGWTYGNGQMRNEQNNRQIDNGYNRGTSGGYGFGNNGYGQSQVGNGHLHNPHNYGYGYPSSSYGYEYGKEDPKNYGHHYGNSGYIQNPDNVRYPNSGYGYEGYVKNRYGYPDFVYGHKYRHPDRKVWMGDSYRDSNVKPSDTIGYGNSYNSGYKDYGRYGQYGGFDSYGMHRSNYGQKDWSGHPSYGKVWYGARDQATPWQGQHGAASNYGPSKVWYRGRYNGSKWQKEMGRRWWH